MKDRMDAVVGALYNAYTTKETFANPNDILNLGSYNSESPYDLSNYANMPTEDLEEMMSGVKRVSLDDLEDPYRYLQ